jgi:hypothetical protein
MSAITAAEYREAVGTSDKPSKYRNEPVVIDGIRFDSKAEAKRWAELQLLLKAGRIGNLRRQVSYPLHCPNGGKIGDYRADHVYYDYERGCEVVEDVKSSATAKEKLYLWKKRHFEAEYRQPIYEVVV